jgi:hypothetical protein
MSQPPPLTEQSPISLLEALEAIERGDLSVRLADDGHTVEPEIARAFNRLVETQTALTAEISRIAREVGAEGRFGGQAEVPGVQGSWADTIAAVNEMAATLTVQVRGLSHSLTGLAMGRLQQPQFPDARGETAELMAVVRILCDLVRSLTLEVARLAGSTGTDRAGAALTDWRRADAPVRSVANRSSVAWTLNLLACDAIAQGRPSEARPLLTELAGLARELESQGNPYWIPATIESLALLAIVEERPELAVRLYGAALEVRERSARPSSLRREEVEATMHGLQSMLGARFDRELQAGREWSPAEAIDAV